VPEERSSAQLPKKMLVAQGLKLLLPLLMLAAAVQCCQVGSISDTRDEKTILPVLGLETEEEGGAAGQEEAQEGPREDEGREEAQEGPREVEGQAEDGQEEEALARGRREHRIHRLRLLHRPATR